MAYSFYRFGTSLILPTAGAKQDIGTGKARIDEIAFPHGGSFDLAGSDQAYRAGQEIKYSCIISASCSSDLVSKYNDICGYLGKKDKLYRKVDGSTDLQWVWARLKEVSAPRKSENINHLNIDLVFFIFSPLFSGELHGSWRFDSGFLFDAPDLVFDTGLVYPLTSGSTTFTIANNGNGKQHSFEFGITASGSPITSIRVQKAGETDFTWTGNLAVGTSLNIDFGALSIRSSGTDAYNGFQLSEANHKLDSWAVLNPGDNEFTITRIGGDENSSVSIAFYDGWV